MAHSQGEGFQWVALTVLGLVAGLALALPLGVPIFAILGAMVGTPVVLSIVGFSLGTAQWPIIRRHVASSGWWIVVSALGMAVGLTAGVVLVESGPRRDGRPNQFSDAGSCGTGREFWSDWNDGWHVSWTGAVAGVAPPRGALQELDRGERVESCGRFGLGVAVGGCSGGEIEFGG